MGKYVGNDIIGQVAETMLKVCASFVNADTYSFYLYDNLFIPIANYFPKKEYPSLNVYPVSHEAPLAQYMQLHHKAVHNQMPEVKQLWEKSSRFDFSHKENLNYVLAAPLLHEGQWMGSINLARQEKAFDTNDLIACENVAKMIVVFFESSEKLFHNNIYFTIDNKKKNGIDLQVHGIDLPWGEQDSWEKTLTNREREVLQLLVDGCTYGEIASRLFVSVNTVKYHLQNIYKKAGVNSKMRLLRMLYKGDGE